MQSTRAFFSVLEGALKLPHVVHFAACAVMEAVLILRSFWGKIGPRLEFWAHLDPFWPSYRVLPLGATFGGLAALYAYDYIIWLGLGCAQCYRQERFFDSVDAM
jgi:hypothetical protein